MKYLIIIVSSFLFCYSPIFAQQAKTIHNVKLKSSPSIKSDSIKTLKPNTSVTIIKRQGGWYHVETSPQLQGWLKMLWLRYNVNTTPKSSFSLITQGTKGTTVATGVRGLSEDELEKGKGDPNAINEIDNYVVTAEQAKQFARAAGLEQSTIPYLTEQ